MTHYQNGRRFEIKVRDALQADGYVTQLAPGSKGAADLWAGKPGQWLFISIKRTNGLISPSERKALVDLANHCWHPAVEVLPLVAYQPIPRKPIVFRHLTGIGPSDFALWTPDQIEGGAA